MPVDKTMIEYLDRRLDRLEEKIDMLMAIKGEVEHLKSLEDDVKKLMKIQWTQMGVIAGVSTVVSLAFEFLWKT